MSSPSNIIAAVDFSDCSKAVLRQAHRLAQLHGAPLHIVHVVTAEEVDEEQSDWVVPTEQLLEKFEGELETLAREALGEGAGFESSVLIGHPFLQLARCQKDFSSPLIVMGAHGWTHDRSRVGVIATRAVRKLPAAILLVREDHSKPYSDVVACTDFSDTAERALAEASDIAARDQARLHVLHVDFPAWLIPHGVMVDIAGVYDPEAIEKHRAALAGKLDGIAAQLRTSHPDLEVLTALRESQNPARAICEYLTDSKADLAVLGTQGRTGLRSLLLGTTAERIIHESPCSVLAIKPADFHWDVD